MVVKILKNIFLLVLSVSFAYFLAVPFGLLLSTVLNIGGSFMGDTLEYYLFGFPLAATFFSVFLFKIFGGTYKLWWIALVLLPVAWLEFQLTSLLLAFSVALAGIAWGLGVYAHKALCKFAPGFMAKVS